MNKADNKRLIKKSMLETVRENEDMASFYAKSRCNDCNGLGILKRNLLKTVQTNMGPVRGWEKVKNICPCVKKTIEKESSAAVEETANV